jgi:hypothetical protein
MKFILCALLMLAATAHASGFQFTVTSQAGHHEYDSRTSDVCNVAYVTTDQTNIGCTTYYHTQPLVYFQYFPNAGEGGIKILVAYLHSGANGNPLQIIEFDGCWIESQGPSFLIATCARSSDDGFVDGFDVTHD